MPREKMTEAEIRHQFTYSKPDAERIVKHEKITEGAIAFALIVNDNTPVSRGQSLAITAIEEARMRANQALATEGGPS